LLYRVNESGDPIAITRQQSPEPENDIDFDALAAQSLDTPDPEALREQKRKRRAALLAQYSAASPNPLSRDLTPGISSSVPLGINSPAKRLRLDSPAVLTSNNGTESPESAHGDAEETFDLQKAEEPQNAVPISAEENISAADYNPDEDRKLDDARQLAHRGGPHVAGQAGATAVADAEQQDKMDEQDVEEDGEEDQEDDEDDMFALDSKPKKSKKGTRAKTGMVVSIFHFYMQNMAQIEIGYRSWKHRSSTDRRSR